MMYFQNWRNSAVGLHCENHSCAFPCIENDSEILTEQYWSEKRSFRVLWVCFTKNFLLKHNLIELSPRYTTE